MKTRKIIISVLTAGFLIAAFSGIWLLFQGGTAPKQAGAGLPPQTEATVQTIPPQTIPPQTEPEVETAAPQTEPEVQTAAPQTEPTVQIEEPWGRTVSRNGQTWRYNSRLTTVLFLGVDNGAREDQFLATGGRADTIALLVLDPERETTTIVMISRDTMTDVDLYTPEGEKMYTAELQLAMQYAFGNSKARSCQLTKRTVSRMLLDLPIDYCCSMDLNGIRVIADVLKDIPVTLDRDFTDVDPRYTAGATLAMSASEAERFIRYRDTEVTGSDNQRMQRQGWLATRMAPRLSVSARKELVRRLEPYLESDVDAQTIERLAKFRLSAEVLTIPGQTVATDFYDEYRIDEEAMKDLLLEVFYRQV